MPEVNVRIMKPEELEMLPRFWIQEVGIPMELRFIKKFYLSDPEGFRVAVDHKGRIVGMASVLKQTDTLFVMGYMGVSKEFRGKGLGGKLLDNLLARNPAANYVLSASNDKLDMYTKKGFKKVDDATGFSYIGKFSVPNKEPPLPEGVQLIKAKNNTPLVSEIQEFDTSICGFKRNVELMHFNDPSSVVLAAKQQGKVVGYGKIQKYMLGGAWVGPVYATESAIASGLIVGLMKRFQSEKCPFVFGLFRESGQSIAKTLNLKLADKLTRCYLKPEAENLPPLKMKSVFVFDDIGFTLV